jgi:integrase
MTAKKSGRFTIKAVKVTCHGFTYETFLLSGWLNGRRVRKHFKSREEALGEKNALEVESANAGGEIRARNTRLSASQLAEAEAAFARLGSKSLALAVEWLLSTYRPPVTEMILEKAVTAFLNERKVHVRSLALRDYKTTLAALQAAFPGKSVHGITTADIQQFLANRNVGKKRFNNLRGDLHAFFTYCQAAPRQWTCENPVKPIPLFRISRGVPEIITAQCAADLMAYVEHYAGGPQGQAQAGCLVPYFALCLFAGLRPSVPQGEVWKLGRQTNVEKFIDLELGVIRIPPEISKTKFLRQVAIQPNLSAWLVKFPPGKFSIIPANARRMIQHVRKKFALGDDVLRHTCISMHVAKFKSLGDAALQAGNSETMIRRHYLNLVSEAEAKKFWAIAPDAQMEGILKMVG